MMNRRDFLAASFAATLAATLRAQAKRTPSIILRSGWQSVNIGDIAHSPGVLAILEKYLPDVEVRLWPSEIGQGVDELLQKRFPRLIILKDLESKKKAKKECDFLLHGSGSGFVAQRDVENWIKDTGKPFGVFGISLPGGDGLAKAVEVLNQAKFVYFRDSVSLGVVKNAGCKSPIMEYGPDGAFATDLRNDAKALAFMKATCLEEQKFICCIPRLRNTPYWTIPSKKRAIDPAKHARNEAMKEHDHKPLRDAIVSIVKETDLKVLLCPEDETQMQVNKEMIYSKLPPEVQKRCVWRENYWLTDEALSVYQRSVGLFGNEMHSPIMCIGMGVPAIVCRWAEQTTKGYMWRDIGLGEWLFDLDKEEEVQKVAPAVLAMAKDPVGSKAKAMKARAFVESRQKAMAGELGKALGMA